MNLCKFEYHFRLKYFNITIFDRVKKNIIIDNILAKCIFSNEKGENLMLIINTILGFSFRYNLHYWTLIIIQSYDIL